MARKILIATSCRWFSAARLAMAFRNAGCLVDAVCPPRHPVFSTRVLHASCHYHGLAPLRSLRSAILSSRPDLIVPCDDLVTLQLHRLYDISSQSPGEEAQWLADSIRFSLGDPQGYPIIESREQVISLVQQNGVRTPNTKTLKSAEDVEQWLTEHGFPAVLKIDGTSGGEGVRIVHSLPEALRAYRILSAPLSTAIVLKRAGLDRDWNHVLPWIWQQRRSVSIQSFVAGPDANIAAACWQGEVLASITAEVLETWRPKGPSTLIHLIKNEEIQHAVKAIVGKLGFSGLCGFDFILEQSTGIPYLIEMNARATQTCPLPLGPGQNLVAALCARLAGEPEPETASEIPNRVIALFPLAWQGDTTSPRFQSAYHDIPWQEPELVRLGQKQTKRRPPLERWTRLFSTMGLH